MLCENESFLQQHAEQAEQHAIDKKCCLLACLLVRITGRVGHENPLKKAGAASSSPSMLMMLIIHVKSFFCLA